MPNKRRSKRVVRQDVIFAYLKEQIVSGQWAPGDRLPPQARIVAQFGSSPLTVERVFRRIVGEGFARAQPGVGTFVANHPPHLCRYALAFPDRPSEHAPQAWSRYFRALSEAGLRVNGAGGARHVKFYYDCNGHIDSEGFGHLLHDLKARTLAGVMFAFSPHDLIGSALFEIDNLKVVASNAPRGRQLATVGHDPSLFLNRALDLLCEQGRRRVGFLTTPGTFPGFWQNIPGMIRERGMTSLPYWTQAVTPYEPYWVNHAVQALLHSHEGLRPDGLICTDDHLVESLADALTSLGVRVPDDLAIVGHWNYPLRYDRDVPIQRLGWDAVELLDRWMDVIDAQRRGYPPVPQRSLIAIRLENELVSPAIADPDVLASRSAQSFALTIPSPESNQV